MPSRRQPVITILFATTCLAACQSLPERTPPPATPEISGWSETALAYESAVSAPAPVNWWEGFSDPVLNELVDKALEQNPDLESMAASVRQARAVIDLTRSGARPSGTLGGSVNAMRLSENGQIPAGQIPGFPVEQVLYSAGFDASYEIDLFGRQDLRNQGAETGLSLAEFQQDDVRRSLIAELTRAYVEFRSVAVERDLLQSALTRQDEIIDMLRIRIECGEATEVEVEQARFRRARTALIEPSLDMRERVAKTQIAVLVGEVPADMSIAPSTGSDLPELGASIALGATSDLLRNRPDIRAAEQSYTQLARQLDLTRLDIYPSISLFGGIGPESTDISDILSPDSIAANLAGMVQWTLFDGGRQEAREAESEAMLAGANARYRSTVLTALGDVEISAIRLGETERSVRALEGVRASAERLKNYASERYEAGVGTLLMLTEAERDLVEVERELIGAKRDAVFAEITLLKAIGGSRATSEY